MTVLLWSMIVTGWSTGNLFSMAGGSAIDFAIFEARIRRLIDGLKFIL